MDSGNHNSPLQQLRIWLRAIWSGRGRAPAGRAGSAFARCESPQSDAHGAAALRESEARYRRLTENAPDIIYRLRLLPERAYEYVNEAVTRTLGFTPEEFYADPQLGISILHPEDRPVAARLTALSPVWPSPSVLRMIHRDGTPIWLEFREVGVFNEVGRVVAVEGVARDVTANRQAQAALEASEAYYRLLADYSADLICLLNHEAHFVYASPSFEALLGYRPADLLGTMAWEKVHPDDLPQLLATWGRLSDMVLVEASYRYCRADGAWRWIEARGAVTLWQGAPVVVISGRDVTDRRQLEQQLAQATKLEGIGRLAGGVAHDFNNLLVVIGGYSELILAELPPDSALRDDFAQVLRATERASALTRQLLAFARRRPGQPQPIVLTTLLAESEPLLRRLIREHVALRLDSQPDLWPVHIDPSQAEQVLMNLAINAGDAMPSGGTITIELANVTLDEALAAPGVLAPGGEYVCLMVCDTGVGMDEETQRRLFEPFFTTKAPGTGTGLGLATCYGIVSQAGGQIVVASELGRGTTVRVYLPRAPFLPAPADTQRQSSPLASGEQLLLVEDEPTVRELGARMLRAYGYSVLVAADGDEALRLLDGPEPPRVDLVLTDVVMPRLGGAGLAAELVQRRPGLPVLYISGYSEQGGLEPGARVLAKPFDGEALARAVREVLDSAAAKASAPQTL